MTKFKFSDYEIDELIKFTNEIMLDENSLEVGVYCQVKNVIDTIAEFGKKKQEEMALEFINDLYCLGFARGYKQHKDDLKAFERVKKADTL